MHYGICTLSSISCSSHPPTHLKEFAYGRSDHALPCLIRLYSPNMAAAIRFPSLLSSTASSRHSVGCVDLMHRNLLVRLFYPTAVVASPDPADLLHTYCQWLPSHEYASGFIDMVQTLIPSMPLPPADVLMSKLI